MLVLRPSLALAVLALLAAAATPAAAAKPSASPAAVTCASVSAAGDCCSSACTAAANPNLSVGVSFQSYNPMCLTGGLGCVGTSGCRMCRLADAQAEQHLPTCPACVCQHYRLAAAKCDRSGSGPAPARRRSPPPPRPRPPPTRRTPQRRPPPPPKRRPQPPPPPPAASRSPPPPPPPSPQGPAIDWGEPVLVERFDGSSLPSLFDAEVDCWGGGNLEKQCYTARPQNVRVQGGRLVIEAVRGTYQGSYEGCTNNNENSCPWTQPFTSARVRTKLSPAGSWLYGRVEVRAQLPKGDFLWPAIWMLPTDSAYGTWAASGEIDIMEFRGQAGLADTIEGTLHYGGLWPNNVYRGSNRRRFPGTDFSAGLHDFAVEWTADAEGRPKLMRWLVDGQQFHEQRLDQMWNVTAASPYTAPGQPWDKRFHLIINLAVGGGFFPPAEFGSFTAPADWDAAAATWSRPRLEVEHVKVWAWPPPSKAAQS